MRRVVVHEILIGAGVALILVAALATGAAQRSLGRYEREAAVLRGRLDSLTAQEMQGRQEIVQVAQQLEEAEFNVRASLQLRARLWRPGGMGMLTAMGGVVVLGAGMVAWRRKVAARRG